MAGNYYDRPESDPRDSIGQPESMRNEEQKLRDNQGGSELTDRPDDHPAGAPGETASAEAEGPPADPFDRRREGERIQPGDNANIGAPVRSAGPEETTVPEESPLTGAFQPGGAGKQQAPPTSNDIGRPRADEKLRNARLGPDGEIVPDEERGE